MKQNKTFLEYKKDIFKIAKDLMYTMYFPEIKDMIYKASSMNELSNIMCTYRKKMIDREINNKEEKYVTKINKDKKRGKLYVVQ